MANNDVMKQVVESEIKAVWRALKAQRSFSRFNTSREDAK